MRINEVTLDVIKAHCGISENDNDTDTLLEMYKTSAVAQIISFTGIPAGELDNYEDITTACLFIINDMYNKRGMTESTTSMNRTAKQILEMHSRNQLA